jgi:hypothetical protein
MVRNEGCVARHQGVFPLRLFRGLVRDRDLALMA